MACRSRTGKDTRIVTLLLALADLADIAAVRSFPVRWLVLWALWQADTIVREHIAESAPDPSGRCWQPALPWLRHGTGRADAREFAASLRALARIVGAMTEDRRRLAVLHAAFGLEEPRHRGGPHPDGQTAARFHDRVFPTTHPLWRPGCVAPDTS